MLFIKWNVTPCSLGRSPGRWGAPLTRGGLGRSPLVAFAWGKVACLGAGRAPPPFAAPPGGALKKGTFPFTSPLIFSLAERRFLSDFPLGLL